jgi:hypothetical protein
MTWKPRPVVDKKRGYQFGTLVKKGPGENIAAMAFMLDVLTPALLQTFSSGRKASDDQDRFWRR